MKTLTVIIPVFNEEKRLSIAFRSVRGFKNRPELKVEKFVFVNDGSRDKTLKLLKEFKKNYSGRLASTAEIEVVSYRENRGRGYAVMQGIKRVKSDYGLFLDSDMSIPLNNLKTFARYMNEGQDVLIGSKKLPQTKTLVKRSFLREFIGSAHSFILCRILGIKLADFTGGFKVFSRRVCRDVFPRLTQERWGLDPEVIYVSHRLGYEIKELPIVWKHVSVSSKVNLLRDILRAFKEMMFIRFNDFNGVYDIPASSNISLIPAGKISPAVVK